MTPAAVIQPTIGTREERRERWNASEVPAMLGIPGAYLSPWEFWAQWHGHIEPSASNELMELGNALEPYIGARYERETGRALNPGFRMHDPNSLASATPDFLLANLLDPAGVVQAKVDNFGRITGMDRVPLSYMVQVIWECGIYELSQGHDGVTGELAVLSRQDLLIIQVPYTRARFEGLLRRVEKWWTRHIIHGIEPDPGASAGYTATLADRWQDNRLTRIASEDDAADLERYAKLKERVSAAEVEFEAIKNRLAAGRDPATEALLDIATPHGPVKWTKTKGRVTTDWKAVTAALAKEQTITMERFSAIVAENSKTGKPSFSLNLRGFKPQGAIGPETNDADWIHRQDSGETGSFVQRIRDGLRSGIRCLRDLT